MNCHCKLFIPKGRINFESGLGKEGKSPAFGSVVIRLADENSVEYIDLKNTTSIEKTKVETVEKTVENIKKCWYR